MCLKFNSITGKPIQKSKVPQQYHNRELIRKSNVPQPIQKSNVPQQYHNFYDDIAKKGGNPQVIDTGLERWYFDYYIRKEVKNGKKDDAIKCTPSSFFQTN